ncbi:MAG: DUF6599 family protein [Thermodesulfobacteriota bacterium]
MMKTICLILGLIIFLWVPGAEAKDFRFPEIKGWKQSGEIQTFIPKTLFEYINGAADLYLMYDFQELKVAEYLNEKKASVIVDVYRHKTPTHAFGIYSQERLSDANFINIGAQGYVEKNVLNFLTGSYYVKLNSFNTGAVSSFPEEGKKKNSEKFIAKNFLGYSFLHSAFTADYGLSGTKFKLFVIEGAGKDECKDMIQKYLQQTKSLEKNIAEGRYTISDPYHGEIELYWRGGYIWGILNLNDPSLRSKYLKLFEEGLRKRK